MSLSPHLGFPERSKNSHNRTKIKKVYVKTEIFKSKILSQKELNLMSTNLQHFDSHPVKKHQLFLKCIKNAFINLNSIATSLSFILF